MINYVPVNNDPGCYWHEFCLLFLKLAKMATKDKISQRNLSDVLKCFFDDFLGLDNDLNLLVDVFKKKNIIQSKWTFLRILFIDF